MNIISAVLQLFRPYTWDRPSEINYALREVLNSTIIYLSVHLQPFVRPWPLSHFFIFSILFTIDRIGREIGPSQGWYLRTEQHKQNKRTQTSMPRVGFEPTTPAFELAKTIHALDRPVDPLKSYYM
jgi:hypothetical protein